MLLAISLYLSLEKGMALHLNKLKSMTQGSFVSSLVEIGYSVLEKIFKIHQCIFAISLLSTFGKGSGLFLIQTWIFFTKNDLCQVCLKFIHLFQRRRFSNFVKGMYIFYFIIISYVWMYICYFIIISPWKRMWPIIWRNLNLLHPSMLCAKFGLF